MSIPPSVQTLALSRIYTFIGNQCLPIDDEILELFAQLDVVGVGKII